MGRRPLPRRKISEREESRRLRQRAQALAAVQPLLYSRVQTSRALGGISVATIIRLENAGLLTKVRLGNLPTAQVYHRVSEVHALAQAGGDHSE
jgi:hypothetical protein